MKQHLKTTLLFVLVSILSSNYSQEATNVLWLVCEDQSMFFSPYGDHHAVTPNLNQLCEDGTVYDNCFTPSPVCSPSRSSIITGMYPTTIGTQHMRAYKKNKKNEINQHNQLPFYSPIPKKNIQFFTEILRANGYYCSNNSKEDYNMLTSPLAWDESNSKAHWHNREPNQPFFSVFNFSVTHESKVWENKNTYSEEELNHVNLPILFPQDEKIKTDFLTNYRNIEKLDQKLGDIIQQLKDDGLYENTIIFFFSDHGGPFPRYKRSIYDTGIQCPLMIKWIDELPGLRNNQLISFVDFAPTLLDVLRFKSNHSMEGVSFYQQDQRKYVFAATDRFDGSTDRRRCIRTKQYKLIHNLDLPSPIGKPIAYRLQMQTMQVLDSLNIYGGLNQCFKAWFQPNKVEYELYDIIQDPNELTNIIEEPQYVEVFHKLQHELTKWMNASDFGNFTEQEMINFMFPNGIAPAQLDDPSIHLHEYGISIEPQDDYVSIGWRNQGENTWQVYLPQEIIQPKNSYEVILFKPGYEVFTQTFN
jgi:arylsulfatase A-like enzyme